MPGGGGGARDTTGDSQVAWSALNAFERLWEGEPPGEPRHHPARTDPRSGVVQSWGCTTLAFVPNSSRKFRERALFFPPLVKGGQGGWAGGRRVQEGAVLGAIDR